MMRVQLVAEGMEEAIEKLRPQETEMDGLNYSSPAEPTSDFSIDQTAAAAATPQKRRVIAGPGRNEPDRTLNRAERRRQKGR